MYIIKPKPGPPKSIERQREMKIEGYNPELGVPSFLFIMIIIIKYFISHYETVQEETWYETHTERQTGTHLPKWCSNLFDVHPI